MRRWISTPASPLLASAMGRELERVSVFPGAAQGGKVGVLECARHIAVGVGMLHGWVSWTNVGFISCLIWTWGLSSFLARLFQRGFLHDIQYQPNFLGFT